MLLNARMELVIITRVTIRRWSSSKGWAYVLKSALSYLARANRFSRAPSQVATYLSATRGTISQTLKALARKELIAEHRSQVDKRSISYGITTKGMTTLTSCAANEGKVDLLTKRDGVEIMAS